MRVRSVLACFAVGVFLAGGGYLAHAGLSRVQFGPGRIVPVTPPEAGAASGMLGDTNAPTGSSAGAG